MNYYIYATNGLWWVPVQDLKTTHVKFTETETDIIWVTPEFLSTMRSVDFETGLVLEALAKANIQELTSSK